MSDHEYGEEFKRLLCNDPFVRELFDLFSQMESCPQVILEQLVVAMYQRYELREELQRAFRR